MWVSSNIKLTEYTPFKPPPPVTSDLMPLVNAGWGSRVPVVRFIAHPGPGSPHHHGLLHNLRAVEENDQQEV